MSPDHLRPHELDGLRSAGIVPIPFESSEPFIPASVRHREEFLLCVQCSAGMHRPAAVCARGCGAVGAAAYCVHLPTLGAGVDKCKPLSVGGMV